MGKVRFFNIPYAVAVLLQFIAISTYGGIDTVLFNNDVSDIPFRIPAVAQAKNGDIIVLSDYRKCRADIGYGEVDVVAKIGKDNGSVWSDAILIADGTGIKNDLACGYGDASVVADKESNEILIMLVTGNVPYPQSTRINPVRTAFVRGTFDDRTARWVFSVPTDVTDDIYSLLPDVTGLFFTSGKIHQSRYIKKDKYYRIYSGLCTLQGNFVVYSDDFGLTWNVLGSNIQSCIPNGDECKCEELPNGDLLLSSRTDYGRIFNIFHYKDRQKGEGYWDKPQMPSVENHGIYNTGTSCNGEILLVQVKRKSDKENTCLILQTMPARNGRNDVTLYYKELKCETKQVLSSRIAKDWQGSFQISTTSSAYSSMIQLADGQIAVFLEESGRNGGYNMRYVTYSVEQITNGRYY